MKIERALAAFARSAQADRTKCDASGGHSRSGSALGIGQFAVIQSVAPTVALQPAPVGRRMVDHRGHSRSCGRSGSVRRRPHQLSPNSWSDPSVPVDRGDLRNAVRVRQPVDFRCIQGDRV